MVVVAGVIISMLAIVPTAVADRDDDDGDNGGGENKKIQSWKKKLIDWWNKKQNEGGEQTQINNQVTLIERSYSAPLKPGERLNETFFCDEGEIVVGGLVKSDSSNSLSSGNWNVEHADQTFTVNISNRDSELITVDVIYLCANMKSAQD